MQMTEKEIIRSYKEAKRKQEQIKILADLNTCQKEDIRKILREAGLEVPATGNRYTKKKEEPEASGSKRKRLLKTEEQTERSDLSAPEDPGKTMFGASLEAKKTEAPEASGSKRKQKTETNCSECQGADGCGSAKPDGIYCSGFKPKNVPVPPEVIVAARIRFQSYERRIEELEQKKKNIDEELDGVRKRAERIRAWLAIESEGKVTCSSCRHLAQEEMQGQATPVSICRAEIWKQVGKTPHVIQHDTEKPIFCNHWEGGEEI